MKNTTKKLCLFMLVFIGANIQAQSQTDSTAIPIINDNFGGDTFDSRIWDTATPFNDSRIYEQNNAAVLVNRGRLLTKFDLPAQYVIQGQFKFTGNSRDVFALYLRTDGVANNQVGSFQNGVCVGFQIPGANVPNNNVALYEENNLIDGSKSVTSFPIELNVSYTFKIIDDSKNLTLYLNDFATPLLTLKTIARAGFRLGIENREGAGGGSSESAGSVTELSYLKIFSGNETTVVSDSVMSPAASTEISIPPAILSAARQLSPPTNEIVKLSSITGEVRIIDYSKGLLIMTNYTDLPWMSLADLQNDDYYQLLENDVAYSTLTTFGIVRMRTAQSDDIEKQMRQIWLRGKTLQDKIQTRLLILDEMRGYNNAVGLYANGIRYGGQAEANASGISSQVAANAADADADAALADDAPELGAARIAYWKEEQAENNIKQLQEPAAIANNKINTAIQMISAADNNASLYASRLANYGIIVPSSPPFMQIPPLSMRLEVDAERVANQ